MALNNINQSILEVWNLRWNSRHVKNLDKITGYFPLYNQPFMIFNRMNSQMAEARINDLSDCAICLEKNRTPRYLPCSHFFCEMCISEYIVSSVKMQDQKTFNCPVCRLPVDTGDKTANKTKWASFLPTSSYISNTPEQFKQQHCHPCKSSNNEAEASLWCCDCNEALCHSCAKVHGRLKITSTHKTVCIEKTENFDNEMVKLLQLTFENCSIHKEERIEIYCKDHSEAICIKCLSSYHRKCQNWQVIDTIDESTDDSIANLKSEMKLVHSSIKLLVDEKNQQKRSLESNFSSTEKESLKVMNDIKKKMDDLHIRFLKNLVLKRDEIQGELDCNIQGMRQFSLALERMIRDLQFVRLYGSKVQILTITQKSKLKLDQIRKDIISLGLENPSVSVKSSFGNVFKIMDTISDLGDIAITKNSFESRFPRDNKTFNIFSTIQSSTISLKLSSVLEFPDNSVLSSVYLDKETCAVLFWNSLGIVLIKSNRTLNAMKVNEMPKKLCFDHTKSELFASCNGCSGFHCKVKGKALERYKYCRFIHKVSGVDQHAGKVYTITEGGILQSEDFEHHETWIKTSVCGINDDIAFDRSSERFSVLHFEKHKIEFGTFSRKNHKPFDDKNKIGNPRSVTFGPFGVLFVAEKSRFVHVIYSDERSIRTVLSRLQKIEHVSDITTSYDNKKLFVSGDRYVEIYDIMC